MVLSQYSCTHAPMNVVCLKGSHASGLLLKGVSSGACCIKTLIHLLGYVNSIQADIFARGVDFCTDFRLLNCLFVGYRHMSGTMSM